LNELEKKKLSVALQIRTYVGLQIDNEVSKAEKLANTHLNNHWPKNFKSGESPNGLLQMIRHWYWKSIEAPRRANISMKTYFSRKSRSELIATRKSNAVTDSEKKEKQNEFELGLPFQLDWYPPQWLVWFAYGPPNCNSRPEFRSLIMAHLTKTKSQPRQSDAEEILRQLGAASKVVRHTHKNKSANVNDQEQLSINTADDHIDRAIKGMENTIMLLEKMTADDVDEDENSEKYKEYWENRKQLRVAHKELLKLYVTFYYYF
jgi:hypothetical protein